MNLILFDQSEWNQPLAAADPRAKHLQTVLKVAVGDQIRVGLLGQGSGLAEVTGLADRVDIAFPTALQPAEIPVNLRLILGHVRPIVMRRIFRDLATAGLAQIWVANAGQSEASYLQASFWSNNQWTQWLRQGAMQGGNVILPEVRRFWSLAEAVAALDSRAAAEQLVCQTGPGLPSLLQHLADRPGNSADLNFSIAVGPERGFLPTELRALGQAGFSPVSLGSRILRTEQAANAVAVLVGQRPIGPG